MGLSMEKSASKALLSHAKNSAPPRRSFFFKLTAVVIGGVVALVPLASGLLVFLDPLRRKGGGVRPVKVALLDAVPDDGIPRQFPVVVEKMDDAWTRYLNVPIGAVQLVRQPGSSEVAALNATCPHAGCLVPFLTDKQCYQCPCHKSAFDVDGARIDPATSPSPRDMDSLQCEVRGKEIWVQFQNFQIATAEKKPKA